MTSYVDEDSSGMLGSTRVIFLSLNKTPKLFGHVTMI